MFTHSYVTTLPLSPLISSIGMQEPVRSAPVLKPINLKERLIAGEDLMGIWIAYQNQDLKCHSKKSFLFTSEMTADNVLGFCKLHGVHPAHLVPFDSDIRLSLPEPVMEAIIKIAVSGVREGGYSQGDIDLANIAIKFERQRIKAFCESVRTRKSRSSEDVGALVDIFNEICDQPLTLKRIRVDLISHQFRQHVEDDWERPPVVEIVKKSANGSQESLLQSARNQVHRRRSIVDEAYKTYVRDYRIEIGKDAPEELLYKVETALEAKGILCREARIADILEILRVNDPQQKFYTRSEFIGEFKNPLDGPSSFRATAMPIPDYFYFRFGATRQSGKFDQHYLIEPDDERLIKIAVDIATYFSAEYSWEKEKKKLPIKESQVAAERKRIEDVFDIEDFQADGFFKRLMTNMALISATLAPSNKNYPVPWLK